MLRHIGSISYKRLEYKDSTILLVGVERFHMQHNLELSDTLRQLKPEFIINQLPSDHPMFINSNSNFLKAWESFVKGKGGKFLLSPRPEHIQEAMLSQYSISVFLKNVLLNSKDFCYTSSNIVYSKHPSYFAKIRNSPFQPDCFMSSLLYQANNPNTVMCTVLGDMPELVYRDNVVRKLGLNAMKEMFYKLFDEIEEKNHEFDVRLMQPEIMIKPKAEYVAEICKQICGTYKLGAAVVDINHVPYILNEWENLQPDPVDLKSLLKISPPDESCSLVEYAEKHVYLDLMLGIFINEYFMKHNFFPYTGVDIIGSIGNLYDMVRQAWTYYYEINGSSLSKHINSIISATIASKNNQAQKAIKPKSKKRSRRKVEQEEEASEVE